MPLQLWCLLLTWIYSPLAFKDPNITTYTQQFCETLQDFQPQLRDSMLMKGVIMLQDGACPHVNHTVQDVLCFICWKMSDYPSYCLDHFPCDFQCAVAAATLQGVFCWEHILADICMEFLPQDLWGLFLNSLLYHKKIPKYVSLEHTSCIYIFQCNSVDKYSKILITKELSLSFHGDRTQCSLLRQTAVSGKLKNSLFQRLTSSPLLG